MNDGSFNLIDEQWIPCLMLDGRRKELSLRQVLLRAREVREVHDASPLVTAALHRLLLAILYRVFHPDSRNIESWVPLWERGAWDEQAVERYLSQHRCRFHLFHPRHPFAQVPYMEGVADRPIAALAMEAASGNNATLFDHGRVEGSEAIPPGRAACHLLAHQAYAIGFGRSTPFYLKDAPLTRGLMVMAWGDNLFETLALNLIPSSLWESCFPQKEDAPFWEQADRPPPEPGGTEPLGRTDYLTWLSRRVHLIADGSPPRVARCQIQQNYCLPADGRHWDPFKAYRRDEKRGWSPLSLAADKAAWRDSHTLLHMRSDPDARLVLLDWLGEVNLLREMGRIRARRQYQIAIFGLSTASGKAASVELWRAERLPLPLAYLQDEVLLDRLGQGLDVARDVGRALRQTILALSRKLAKGADAERLATHLATDNLFWPRLEEPFRRLIQNLPENPGAISRWADELGQAARRCFRSVWRKLETSPGALRPLVAAEAQFRRELAGALAPIREEGERESAG